MGGSGAFKTDPWGPSAQSRNQSFGIGRVCVIASGLTKTHESMSGVSCSKIGRLSAACHCCHHGGGIFGRWNLRGCLFADYEVLTSCFSNRDNYWDLRGCGLFERFNWQNQHTYIRTHRYIYVFRLFCCVDYRSLWQWLLLLLSFQ
jgi:hypothetical protein